MTIALGKKFEPPRPGAWEIDLTHFPRPLTKIGGELLLPEFSKGFAEGTKMYGLLLERMEQAVIHGFVYAAPRPVGAPLDAKGPPPKFVFKLLTWLHPEIRRRIRTSKDAIDRRLWLEDLKHWDDDIKPRAIRENQAIQSVDVQALDDAALAKHLGDAAANARMGNYRHGRFTMTACLPVGDLLAHARAWTGQPVHTLLRTVKGYSKVSNGVADQELKELVALIAESSQAASLLDQRPAEEAFASLRSAEGELGQKARAWLDQISFRMVTGYDVADRYGSEMPQALMDCVRAVVSSTTKRESQEAVEADVTKLRDQVPDRHRAEFDELLADARAVYRLREERDHYNDGWSTGLLRRALLEAGRRAAAKGRLSSSELMVEASLDEAQALLAGRGGPSDSELAARAAWRTEADPTKAPEQLGLPPSAPPPAEWLAPHAARFARAIDVFLGALFQPSEQTGTAEIVRGIPVSHGVYEGPARVVLGASDFDSVKQGDVLVARSTSPYFNALLPLLGGIVTDRGGSLSHAAIVAREYGIPGVVGTKTATTLVKSGMRIRVDGGAGEVQILA